MNPLKKQKLNNLTKHQKGILIFLLHLGAAFVLALLLTLGIIYAG
jgi:hypothetical protein